MRARIELTVRYWSFLLGKLALAAALTAGLIRLADRFSPNSHFGYDLLYTTVTGVVFLIGYGLAYLAILDQRYRCRVCLRRLRMPVVTGSWSRMLQFGRPRIEYICIYGHGKLNVEELQFTGTEAPAWQRHNDMWDELFAISKKTDSGS
jgi:hypothetical protein